jgi:hypothetical protein
VSSQDSSLPSRPIWFRQDNSSERDRNHRPADEWPYRGSGQGRWDHEQRRAHPFPRDKLLGAAEVLTLSYLERRPQLALLRSLGWPRPAIAGLIIGEGAVIAITAAVAAVATVVAIGFGLGATPVVALASVAAAATAVVLTIAALFVPTLMGFAIDPARGLHRA